jgi:uridine phosphorylase
MIIHDYDDKTKPVIDVGVFYGEKKHLLDKCLILFSKEIHDHLLGRYDCAVVGDIGACNGVTPIYRFDLDGESVAFYLSAIGSAIASGSCYEAHWQTGATKFVMFGSCGSLDGARTKGKYIVPTAAYRGEGASYYYVPAADYIQVKNAPRVAAILKELGAPHVEGPVWTTDSMLRETVGLVQKRRAEGCIAVEMEVAGVQALCDFYGLELYDFLEAGDVLAESSYDAGGLKSANHDLGKLYLGLEIAKRI